MTLPLSIPLRWGKAPHSGLAFVFLRRVYPGVLTWPPWSSALLGVPNSGWGVWTPLDEVSESKSEALTTETPPSSPWGVLSPWLTLFLRPS